MVPASRAVTPSPTTTVRRWERFFRAAALHWCHGNRLSTCRLQCAPASPGRFQRGSHRHRQAPVEGPVKVHKLGLQGDIQANRVHHGGPDQAIYAYSQADADYWAGELQRELPPGIFGENLRVAGIEPTNAVIGERWKIGMDVEVEVTSPRTPCATFQRRMGEPQFVKRFTGGRPGGRLSSGDRVGTIRPATTSTAACPEARRHHGPVVQRPDVSPWKRCATPMPTARSGFSSREPGRSSRRWSGSWPGSGTSGAGGRWVCASSPPVVVLQLPLGLVCALHLKYPPLRKSLIPAQFLRQDWQVLGPANVMRAFS
jgi:hypothetical protein